MGGLLGVPDLSELKKKLGKIEDQLKTMNDHLETIKANTARTADASEASLEVMKDIQKRIG
jgi:Mg2+ and Co2+ transporter CorA